MREDFGACPSPCVRKLEQLFRLPPSLPLCVCVRACERPHGALTFERLQPDGIAPVRETETGEPHPSRHCTRTRARGAAHT